VSSRFFILFFFFFFNDTATTEIYTLSLHDALPIFVRFPKPPVLRGRDGVERFPPAADVPFEDAVVRQLVRLDRRVRPNQVKDLIAEREQDDVRRALAAVRRTRPDDVLAYFRKVLGARVDAEAGMP